MPWREAAAGIEARWRRLEAGAAGSFFLSWSWIGSYVAAHAQRADFHLFEWLDDSGDDIALALIDVGSIRRRKLFRIPVVTLNMGVDPSADMCLEYNGVLSRAGREVDAQDRFVEALQQSPLRWHELQLRNLDQPGFGAGAAASLRRVDDDPFNGWVADLSPNHDVDALLQRLSSNRRSQIRRSLKACAEPGPLQVHEAQNLGTALQYFARLGELHNARWRREGIAGAFESPDWVAFHEAVIQQALPRGEVQLLRIAAGDTDVGYLYNFRWRGSIAMVQSGFAESANNAQRPGYVCHLLAMVHNAERGITQYDFLGGDAEYKHVLGTRQTSQLNLRLQRPDVASLKLEEWLVQCVRRWRARQP